MYQLGGQESLPTRKGCPITLSMSILVPFDLGSGSLLIEPFGDNPVAERVFSHSSREGSFLRYRLSSLRRRIHFNSIATRWR